MKRGVRKRGDTSSTSNQPGIQLADEQERVRGDRPVNHNRWTVLVSFLLSEVS